MFNRLKQYISPITALSVLLATFTCSVLIVPINHVQALDLQAEAEIDGLKFDLIQALQTQQHQQALDIVDQLQQRGAVLSPDISYFEAQAAAEIGANQRALDAAQTYLATEPSGSFAEQATAISQAAVSAGATSSAVGLAGAGITNGVGGAAVAAANGAGVATSASGGAAAGGSAMASSASGGGRAAKRALELALNLVVSASTRSGSKQLAQTASYDSTILARDEPLNSPTGGYFYAGFCNQISPDGRFILLPSHRSNNFVTAQEWAAAQEVTMTLYDRASAAPRQLRDLPSKVLPCESFFWKSSLYLAFEEQKLTHFLKINPKTGSRIRLEQVSPPGGCGVGLRAIRRASIAASVQREHVCSGNIRYRFAMNNNQGSMSEILSDSWSKREAQFDPESTPLQGCNDEGSRCIFYSDGFYVGDWPHKLGQKLDDVPSDPQQPRRLPGQLSGDGQWLVYSHADQQRVRVRQMPKLL